MPRMPLAPGAYMDNQNKIWLLEEGQFGTLWRMPGGLTVRQSAFVTGTMAKVAEERMPFRRMAPVRRKTKPQGETNAV